jgi:hypothetical protein
MSDLNVIKFNIVLIWGYYREIVASTIFIEHFAYTFIEINSQKRLFFIFLTAIYFTIGKKMFTTTSGFDRKVINKK